MPHATASRTLHFWKAFSAVEKRAWRRRWLTAERLGLRLPDFIGIGAQKAGTTWLAHNLRAHPDIFVPARKEQHYFNLNFHFPISHYAREFRPAGRRVAGEITPAYSTMSRDQWHFISTVMPDVKLVLLLRHPVERAWSHAMMNLCALPGRRFEDVNPLEFFAHFESPGSRDRTCYTQLMSRLVSHFPPSRIHIDLYENVSAQPREMLARVFGFLGVDTEVDWDKFPIASRINAGTGQQMPPEYRAYLEALYRTEIERQIMIFGDRIAHWRVG